MPRRHAHVLVGHRQAPPTKRAGSSDQSLNLSTSSSGTPRSRRSRSPAADRRIGDQVASLPGLIGAGGDAVDQSVHGRSRSPVPSPRSHAAGMPRIEQSAQAAGGSTNTAARQQALQSGEARRSRQRWRRVMRSAEAWRSCSAARTSRWRVRHPSLEDRAQCTDRARTAARGPGTDRHPAADRGSNLRLSPSGGAVSRRCGRQAVMMLGQAAPSLGDNAGTSQLEAPRSRTVVLALCLRGLRRRHPGHRRRRSSAACLDTLPWRQRQRCGGAVAGGGRRLRRTVRAIVRAGAGRRRTGGGPSTPTGPIARPRLRSPRAARCNVGALRHR